MNIDSTLNRNVLNHEHAQEHLGTTILLTRQLCSVRSGIYYYEHSFVFVWLSSLKKCAHNTLSNSAHISHSDIHAVKR